MSCPGAFSGGRRKTGMKAANDAQMRGECRLIGEQRETTYGKNTALYERR